MTQRATAPQKATPSVVALAVCTAVLCGCSGGGGGDTSADKAAGTRPDTAQSVTSQLGSVPIPSAPMAQPTPVATTDHPQLLAIGQPVRVEVGGADATVTALGPYELSPYTGGAHLPTSTVGIIRIVVTPTRGTLDVRAADFLSRDETGTVVALQPEGAAHLWATATHPATLRVKGRFESGAAQVTWRYDGKVLAIWDFNIELD